MRIMVYIEKAIQNKALLNVYLKRRIISIAKLNKRLTTDSIKIV